MQSSACNHSESCMGVFEFILNSDLYKNIKKLSRDYRAIIPCYLYVLSAWRPRDTFIDIFLLNKKRASKISMMFFNSATARAGPATSSNEREAHPFLKVQYRTSCLWRTVKRQANYRSYMLEHIAVFSRRSDVAAAAAPRFRRSNVPTLKMCTKFCLLPATTRKKVDGTLTKIAVIIIVIHQTLACNSS